MERRQFLGLLGKAFVAVPAQSFLGESNKDSQLDKWCVVEKTLLGVGIGASGGALAGMAIGMLSSSEGIDDKAFALGGLGLFVGSISGGVWGNHDGENQCRKEDR